MWGLRFLFILSCLRLGNVEYLEPEVFFQRLHSETSVLLLDVRPFSMYAEGHIERAVWAGEAVALEGLLDNYDKRKAVFIYCGQGDRTRAVRKILRKRGYKTVFELKDGYKNWVEQGLPVFHP